MHVRPQRLVDRYLSPGDSLSEILFGLIMTLTFTLGAGVLVRESPDAARELLAATIGCNLAWGIIDALMYLGGQRFERGRKERLADAIRSAASEDEASRLVAGELDELLAHVTEPGDRDALYRKIAHSVQRNELPPRGIAGDDVRGALASFLLVLFSSIPAAVPFLFIERSWVALRISNAILIGLLFVVGYRWARHTNLPPVRVGLALTVGGVALVAVAIALGG
jgi:hypothetical protein